MAKLGFENQQEDIEIEDGEPIKDYCENAGLPFACTEGICGTCTVVVVEGMENLSPLTQEEKDFLGEHSTERLACQCKIKNGYVKLLF